MLSSALLPASLRLQKLGSSRPSRCEDSLASTETAASDGRAATNTRDAPRVGVEVVDLILVDPHRLIQMPLLFRTSLACLADHHWLD